MIKMKLLEIDRVNAVWNRYVVNKIIVIIIKSENNWLKLNCIIHLINLKTYRDVLGNNLKDTREGFVFWKRRRESLQGVC